jgi:hypothetical protein
MIRFSELAVCLAIIALGAPACGPGTEVEGTFRGEPLRFTNAVYVGDCTGWDCSGRTVVIASQHPLCGLEQDEIRVPSLTVRFSEEVEGSVGAGFELVRPGEETRFVFSGRADIESWDEPMSFELVVGSKEGEAFFEGTVSASECDAD